MTLSDIIVEKKLDILCLVETWHKQSDGLLFNELTPAGYVLFDLPRSSGRGGGIIVLYNQQYSLSPVAAPLFNSFECLVLTISESLSTAIVTVYRPPKANKDIYLNLQSCCLICASNLREFLFRGILTSTWTKKILH